MLLAVGGQCNKSLAPLPGDRGQGEAGAVARAASESNTPVLRFVAAAAICAQYNALQGCFTARYRPTLPANRHHEWTPQAALTEIRYVVERNCQDLRHIETIR